LEGVLSWKMQGTENFSRLPVLQSVDSTVRDYVAWSSLNTWKCVQIYTHVCQCRKSN